jgi:hypothetical protein
MNAIVLDVLLALAAAAGPAPTDNPVLADLTQKGVAMPDGSAIKLRMPILTDGMDEEAQTKAITELAANKKTTYERFTEKNSAAPHWLDIRTVRGKGDGVIRTIDLGFIAYGDWDTFTSKKFGESIFKAAEKSDKKSILSRSGYLNDEEMAKRGLTASKGKIESRYFYTTFTLFDMAEVSATRYAVLTKTPSSYLLAARIDPQFADDPEFPNQWRSVERDATAELVYGKKQPYSGAGFYAKVTRLTKPDGAIFVEYHSAFNEPKGWFDGGNVLRSKVPTIVEHQVKQFRGRLAKASAAAKAAAQPAVVQPAAAG